MDVTFRGITMSEDLCHYVRMRSDAIEAESTFEPCCRVLVWRVRAAPGRGARVGVTVFMTTSYGPVQCSRTDEDPFLAVRDAFDEARRLLLPEVA